ARREQVTATEAAPGTRHETPQRGLSAVEVAERVARGETNDTGERTSRTFGEIVRANVFTRFNAILGSMLVVILIAGPLNDALFGIVLVTNTLIGIVQEVRAKRTLDRLAVLSAPRARAIRDGRGHDLAVEQVVLDDLLELRTGDQLPADGIVRSVDGLEIDESLLTGESEPVDKETGDEVLSGSFVVAGAGRFQTTRVGDDAYARKLAAEARRFTLVHSELVAGINQILRYVTVAILIAGSLLLLSQFRVSHEGWREAVTGTVAGVVGMVPEGLVLLTSIAFAVAAVTLARRKVLVQELPAVEGLARVDVVCLDKTGTLTEGEVVFDRLDLVGDVALDEVERVLGALADDENANATLQAIGYAFPPPEGWERTLVVPFSSARKWSAAEFGDHGAWIVGAPEMVWAHAPPDDPVRARAEQLAAAGSRVLLLARARSPLTGDELPVQIEAVALVLLEEKIRPDASDTLRYFAEQGVELKVISGDNPRTVAAVAQRVGLPRAGDPIDARELPEDEEELAEILEQRTVFGRVSPHQKQGMVRALQSKGHVVAMTGDGVNDALALKLADIGVAMGSGAPATRAVAQLVLLDGRFATMPGVVAEGRRVIANIERVANLFITKTVYATLLALTVGVAQVPYPFLPRHLTLVSTLTIGVPAFFLSLAPNKRRYVPGFVRRVLRFTVPAGFIAAAATFGTYALARAQAGVSRDEASTLAALVLLTVGLWVLVILARPFTVWRVLLVLTMVAAFVLALLWPVAREFYALDVPRESLLFEGAAIAAGTAVLLEIGWRLRSTVTGVGRRVGARVGSFRSSRAA
ncbi:MAG TPA: HAD-IC family P-type ATPase, partial [Acidimicrobiia bacterium]|nr:HAD-IC family P-type ATPase [Acidimicrobiia bacterium]